MKIYTDLIKKNNVNVKGNVKVNVTADQLTFALQEMTYASKYRVLCVILAT